MTEPGLEVMCHGTGTERRRDGMSALEFLDVNEDFGRAFAVDLGLRESVLLGGLGGFFLAVDAVDALVAFVGRGLGLPQVIVGVGL